MPKTSCAAILGAVLVLLAAGCGSPDVGEGGLDLLAEGGLSAIGAPGRWPPDAYPRLLAHWTFDGQGPMPWELRTREGRATRVRVREVDAERGRVLCVKSRGGGAEAEVRTHVAVRPGASYRLAGLLRAEDLRPQTAEAHGTLYVGEFSEVRPYDRDQRDASRWHRAFPSHRDTADAWVVVQSDFRTGPETRMLRIGAVLGSGGTSTGRVCIDDVKLSELEPADEIGARERVGPALVGDELRYALRAEPPSAFRAELVVPAHGRLTFSTGIEQVGGWIGEDGVRFLIELETKGEVHTLYSRHVRPSDGWVDASVSLDAYAGLSVGLVLRTEASAIDLETVPFVRDLAVWGHPALWSAEDRSKQGAPDVFLLTVDTLRSDHLGAYGYERPTSPSIDAFAAEGILFENAFTPVPRTTPALASLLTGRQPRDHGLRTLLDSLSGDQQTLGEALRARGYGTAAFVTPNVPRKSGLWRGFDLFVDHVDEDPEAQAGNVAARALRWVAANRDRRIFLWLHLWDPHFRYDPPRAHAAAFDPAPETPIPVYERLDRREITLGQLYFESDLGGEDLDRLVARYDAEIRYTDEVIGRFLERLRGLGLYDPALVVFTADHGESLGEHDYHFEHGAYVYDASLRVPMIVKPPRGEGSRRVARPVMLFDLAPAILSLAGAVRPTGEGSLADLLDREGGTPPEAVFHESGRRFFPENPRRPVDGLAGHWKSVREGDWKLIRIPRPEGDLHELYDLAGDPGETRNLYRAGDPIAQRLEARLDRWLADFPDPPDAVEPAAIDPAEAERLRALGYMD